jgi:serine/threonine protein phosphatase PrpC
MFRPDNFNGKDQTSRRVIMSYPDDAETMKFEFPLEAVQSDLQTPKSVRPAVDFGAVSDRGLVRPQNEDAFVIYREGRFWERIHTNLGMDLPGLYQEENYVMAVADGMGGQKGGRIASHLAIRLAVNLVLNSPQWVVRLDNPETREREIREAKQRTQEYFRKVDQALAGYMTENPQFAGMGTTMTAVMISGRDLFTMHTGDSRAYLLRENKLYRLTRDQTVAQALVDAGAITPEQVSRHWLKHQLVSCLGGTSREVNLEIGHIGLFGGDNVLVCTDGLTDMIGDDEIAGILATETSAQTMCRNLADAALRAGGRDNVTVLTCRYFAT